MLILVVEDDDDLRQSMAGLLEEWGHEVQSAASGIEAVERAQQHVPDVVLMDLKLPVMNGFTATEHIREIPELQHAEIFAVSAYLGQPEWRDRAAQAGCHKCFSKPVDMEALGAELLRVGSEAYCRRLYAPERSAPR